MLVQPKLQLNNKLIQQKRADKFGLDNKTNYKYTENETISLELFNMPTNWDSP